MVFHFLSIIYLSSARCFFFFILLSLRKLRAEEWDSCWVFFFFVNKQSEKITRCFDDRRCATQLRSGIETEKQILVAYQWAHSTLTHSQRWYENDESENGVRNVRSHETALHLFLTPKAIYDRMNVRAAVLIVLTGFYHLIIIIWTAFGSELVCVQRHFIISKKVRH